MQQCKHRVWHLPEGLFGSYFAAFIHTVASHRCYFHCIYTKSEKSGKCSVAALGFYFSLLDTVSVFGELGFGLLVLPKWMPQVVKRDTPGDMCGMCFCLTLHICMYSMCALKPEDSYSRIVLLLRDKVAK